MDERTRYFRRLGRLRSSARRWSVIGGGLAAVPPPPAPPPALPGAKLMAAVERFPAGRQVVQEMRRQRDRHALRGSAVAKAWDRLDRAAVTLQGLSARLTGGPGEEAVLEAASAEHWLRDLGQRVASVERAVPISPPDQKAGLVTAHESLARQFTEGVSAYERLVAAAAGYVAEDGRVITDNPATARLAEAADMLRHVAAGLAELRASATPPPLSYPG